MYRFIEFLPIVIFFALYKLYNIFVATIGIGITSVITLLIEYSKHKKVSKLSLINLATLLIMGGSTIIMDDSSFIKMKPTIIYSGVALFLLIDIIFLQKFYIQKIYVSLVDSEVSNDVWRKFSIHWIVLLFTVATTNEIIWRISEDYWINFKVFFIPILLITMMLFHVVYVMRYIKNDKL